MVDDIVEPVSSPRAWFELWFTNGAVLRLRSDADHWATWTAHFVLYCPKVRQRLSSTLSEDSEQSVAFGNSPQQLRGEEVRSLRSAAVSVPEVALIVGSHPDFKPAPPPPPPADPNGPHFHLVTNHLTEIKDALGGQGQQASMVEDRLTHLEMGVKSNHLEANRALADLTSIVDAIAGNVGSIVSKEADISTTLSTVLTHVGAVGARVEENTLRVRSDISSLKSSVEHLEKLCLGLSPRVVVPVGGSRSGSRGGPFSPSASVEGGLGSEILSALMSHSRAMDESLSHVAAKQKASEDAVAAMNGTLSDIARAMVELSNRQEALWKAVTTSQGGPNSPTKRSSIAPSGNVPGDSGSPRPPNDGMATLRAQQAALLADLSKATSIDLTTSQSVIGAISRIPLSLRSRPDVHQLLSRLRILDSALAQDGK